MRKDRLWCARTNAHTINIWYTSQVLIMLRNAVLDAQNVRYLGLVAAIKIELEETRRRRTL